MRVRIRESETELDDLLDFTIRRMTGNRSEKLIGKVKRIIDRRLGKDYPWPGNVRELEQCVRSVLLSRDYSGKSNLTTQLPLADRLAQGIAEQNIPVADLVSGYCYLLYEKLGTYEKVAKKTGLDRRTIKKYITNFNGS